MSLWHWKDLTLKSTHHNRSKCSKICKTNTHLDRLLWRICAFTCFFTCHQQTDRFCQRKRWRPWTWRKSPKAPVKSIMQTGGCIGRFASRLKVDLELSSHVKMFHQSQVLPLKRGRWGAGGFNWEVLKDFVVGTLLPAHSWSQQLETTS